MFSAPHRNIHHISCFAFPFLHHWPNSLLQKYNFRMYRFFGSEVNFDILPRCSYQHYWEKSKLSLSRSGPAWSDVNSLSFLRGWGRYRGKSCFFFFLNERKSCQLHGLMGINFKDESHYQLMSELSPCFWRGWFRASLGSAPAILWLCHEADLTQSFPCLSPCPAAHTQVIERSLHEWNIWWQLSFTISLNQSKPVSFRSLMLNHLIIGMGWLESLSLCFRTYFTLWFLLPQARTPRGLRNLPLAFYISSWMTAPPCVGLC